MCSHTVARGVRGHGPPENFDKNGAIWGVPKYVITNLKIKKIEKKIKKTELPYFSLRSILMSMLVRNKASRIYNGVCVGGGLGASPTEAEEYFYKIKQNGGFS